MAGPVRDHHRRRLEDHPVHRAADPGRLQGISADIYEAAKIDGATAWQRFTKITLPLVKPALLVAVIFRTLDVLRMYDLP